MKQNWQNAVLKHVYAVLIFLGLSFLFCRPVLDGLELRQHDTISWRAMSQEAREYHQKTGIGPLWTNSMFGGMPTYQIYMAGDNYVNYIHQALSLGLPKPVNFFFLAMLGFYFMLCTMGFRHWICIAGAIAFGFSSYNPIIIAAGHDTKMLCMVYMAPFIAGVLMAYRGRWLTGGIVACIAMSLIITNNHYQMAYYTVIIAVALGIGYLVHSFREKTLPQYFKTTAALIGFGILAVLPSMVNLWPTYEYAKYTMRGGHSELTLNEAQNSTRTEGGLDKEYAFRWSMGPMETLTTLIPNLYGGSGAEDIGTGSESYKALVSIGVPPVSAEQFVANYPLYWGPQPGTSAVYFGASVMFLFVLSLFLIKDWRKWLFLPVIIFAVLLSWGSHLAFFNNFLFDHMPMYNKFRAPSQSLVIAQLLVPLMACWVLHMIVTGTYAKEEIIKQLKKATLVTGGICLLFIIASFGMLRFEAENDAARNFITQSFGNNNSALNSMLSAMISDRASALRGDAFRSLVIVLLAAGLVWLLMKNTIKASMFVLLTGVVVAGDLLIVAHRYLNKDNYVTPADYAGIFAPTAVDQAILQDPDPYYRVLNVASGVFDDALTSYHHKSIGGYHAAKLALYNDLIEFQLSKNNPAVLNMLNTKYIIFPNQQQQGQLAYQQNPDALGNAWFVQGVRWAANANEEMKALDNFSPRDTAVIDVRFKPLLEGYTFGRDSASSVKLTKYGLNELQFRSSNGQNGLAVFSDIYYPAGWEVFIDGKKSDIIKVDYLLRGVKIPAGQHEVVMRFTPRSYYLGNAISRYSSILIFALLLGAIYLEWRQRKQTA